MKTFVISTGPIAIAPLMRELEQRDAGAVVCFEGRVRAHNEGRGVSGLVYQAYSELAEAEGARVVEEARAKFAVAQALCVHRIGELALGELAVWVGVSAAHRDAAFAACRYVIDEIKLRVPIWKRELYTDGDADWLHPIDRPVE